MSVPSPPVPVAVRAHAYKLLQFALPAQLGHLCSISLRVVSLTDTGRYPFSHIPHGRSPGGLRMYSTLRRTLYWPSMSSDVYNCVRHCAPCAKQRVKLRRHASFMKLFPATLPLEYVVIDILELLPRTSRGNRNLLVISDRYDKMTQTAPLANVTGLTVARAVCEKWVFPYGPPAYFLSYRGGQFTGKFFQNVFSILGIRNAYTSAYHPQTNGQVERFNRTILSALRSLFTEEGKDWDTFSPGVTFGYNCTVHRAIGVTPYNLVLSCPPPNLCVENE